MVAGRRSRCVGRVSPLVFLCALMLLGCDDGTQTDDLSWAINGEKTGVFSQAVSFGSCFLNLPSQVTPKHHASFAVHFEQHPEISLFLFDLTPFPSVTGHRTLGVGRLGVYVHKEEIYTPGIGWHGLHVNIFGRAEYSLGETVKDDFGGIATEFFVHTLVLPKQTLTAPEGRTFEIEESRFKDLRFYCQDAGGLP